MCQLFAESIWEKRSGPIQTRNTEEILAQTQAAKSQIRDSTPAIDQKRNSREAIEFEVCENAFSDNLPTGVGKKVMLCLLKFWIFTSMVQKTNYA